jgi:hypothetical protein
MKVSKVTAADRYLRIAVFGSESVGKTDFLLRGPGEVLVFDVEGRIASFAGNERIKPFSKVEYDEHRIVADFVEAATEVRTGNTPFKTFGLDSMTDLELRIDKLDGFSTKLASDGRSPLKGFQLADKRTYLEREVLNATLTGPSKAHFVWTAHQKNVWVGRDMQGFQPDATRNFSHYFDLVFHMQLDKQTKARTAIVTKSNYGAILPVGMVITNLGWEHLSAIIKNEVAVDNVTMDEIVALFEKTGRKKDQLAAWFTESGFIKRDDKWKFNAEEKLRIAGLLRTEIEDLEAGVAA